MADAATDTPLTPALVAKAALRRLVREQREPTPANFARAYAEEAGEPPAPAAPAPPPAAEAPRAGPDGEAWARLIERVLRGAERSGNGWTVARRKSSLQRVLDGSRSDAARLHQRLTQLVGAWGGEGAAPDEPAEPAGATGTTAAPVAAGGEAPAAAAGATAEAGGWPLIAAEWQRTVAVALPPRDTRARELADELAALAARIGREGASAELVAAVAAACGRARRLLEHRHELADELAQLCRALTEGLTELAENESWARGQCEALQARLAHGDGQLSPRSVRAAGELLAATRERQRALRGEREAAREALKSMIGRMLAELGELGSATGRFSDSVTRYADVIEQADSLESLAGVVREMVSESRAVHGLVAGARERLASEHARAGELQARVLQLEAELRRLSDEVSTDALTQVANRRGLMSAFEAERARVEREAEQPGAAPSLAVGLIDIDNFKKLNDSLGHAAGDVALQSLAARVRQWLRPVDHLARFGGEEFVVLLPGTPVEEAQQVLTRLQRQLTASLFMHEGKEVFVTFSAGVSAYRIGEPLDAALERADVALYEAKRTGKNRTCIG